MKGKIPKMRAAMRLNPTFSDHFTALSQPTCYQTGVLGPAIIMVRDGAARKLSIQLNCGSEGWMPNEIWDAAREVNRAAYAEWMESAKELGEAEGMTPENADRLWRFDVR
ncbi:hypothetical protein MGYG_06437 [Nannizzia gypsea CBS 118893]|uniref:Uncharacterized protein n=1 Tax=Arthroderma gypseum (strain ATCC MYA-4604 / CBS 118893) TaxID=535722 RepID=E4UZA9_ARTGP|nr:hypothetical protein MGYG_06437 [Nannizzia gypsea CBS 118893]EFR03439.1 hypothetical protein MGYG_06437 [Nannizzia gypsea CBS 118893]